MRAREIFRDWENLLAFCSFGAYRFADRCPFAGIPALDISKTRRGKGVSKEQRLYILERERGKKKRRAIAGTCSADDESNNGNDILWVHSQSEKKKKKKKSWGRSRMSSWRRLPATLLSLTVTLMTPLLSTSAAQKACSGRSARPRMKLIVTTRSVTET